MSGGIHLKNDDYWKVAGWCFRAVIGSVVECLANNDAFNLYEHFSDDECIELIIDHVDTTEWPDDKAKHFYTVIVQSFEQSNAKSDPGFSSPEFFEGYINQFGRLAKLAKKNLETLESESSSPIDSKADTEMSKSKRKLPNSIANENNSEILGFLQGKSCHGDIVEPLEQILRALDDVDSFCPDPQNFAYCVWFSNNIIFAFGMGMREIGVRLPPQQSQKDKRPAAFAGRFDSNEWWTVGYDSPLLQHWAIMSCNHTKNL